MASRPKLIGTRPEIKVKTAGIDLNRLLNGKFIPERKNTGSCSATDQRADAVGQGSSASSTPTSSGTWT